MIRTAFSFLLIIGWSTSLLGAIVTSTNDSGPGSLRQLVADAIPGEIITFDENVFPGVIQFNSSIIIDKNLTISGFAAESRNVRFDGGSNAFVITTPNIDVTIEHVTFSVFTADESGAMIYADAVNLNINITNVLMQNALAVCDQMGEECKGSMIYFKGDTLNVTNSKMLNSNSVCEYDGCVAIAAGIFAQASELNIKASYFENLVTVCINDSCQAKGGAIYVVDTSVNIENSYFDEVASGCFADNCITEGGLIYAENTAQNVNLTHNLIKDTEAVCQNNNCMSNGNLFNESIGSTALWQLSGNILHQRDNIDGNDCVTNTVNQIVSLGNNLQAGSDCFTQTLSSDILGPVDINYIIKSGDFINDVSSFSFATVTDSPAVNAVQGMCNIIGDLNGNLRPIIGCDIGPLEGNYFNWSNLGTGELLDGSNWDVNSIPDSTSEIIIRNNGIALLNPTTPRGASGDVQFKNIYVGDHSNGGQLIVDGGTEKFGTLLNDLNGDIFIGSTQKDSFLFTGLFDQTESHLNIQNINEFIVGDDLYLGTIHNRGDAEVDILANLTLSDVNTVYIGDDFEVGEQELGEIDGGTLKVEVDVDIKNIQSFTVVDEFDIFDGSMSNADEVSLDYTATVLFEEVDSLLTTGLDLIEVGFNNKSDVMIDMNVIFKDIPNFNIWTGVDDDELGHLSTGYGEDFYTIKGFDKIPVVNGNTLFDNVNLSADFMSLFSEAEIENNASFSVDQQIRFVKSFVQLQDQDLDEKYALGILNADSSVETTNSSATVNQHLFLDATEFIAKNAIIGQLDSLVPNLQASAKLTLDNASFMDFSEDLQAYPMADFTFHIDGLNRADDINAGNPGYYSSIDVESAQLANSITVDFDEALTNGTHHFDLIVSNAIDGINDDDLLPENLNVLDLDPGMAVDSFSVIVDSGVEKLRLSLSGNPTASDLEITSSSSSPFHGQTVDFSVIVTNNGPANQSNVAVSSVIDSDLQNITWSCVAASGSNCQTINGTGNLNNTLVNLDTGTSVTFNVTAQVQNISRMHNIVLSVAGSAIDYHQNNNQTQLILDSDTVFKNGFE